jgi:hypothetical protein
VFIGISRDLIVDVEPVGYDQLVLVPDVFRQMDVDRTNFVTIATVNLSTRLAISVSYAPSPAGQAFAGCELNLSPGC